MEKESLKKMSLLEGNVSSMSSLKNIYIYMHEMFLSYCVQLLKGG